MPGNTFLTATDDQRAESRRPADINCVLACPQQSRSTKPHYRLSSCTARWRMMMKAKKARRKRQHGVVPFFVERNAPARSISKRKTAVSGVAEVIKADDGVRISWRDTYRAAIRQSSALYFYYMSQCSANAASDIATTQSSTEIIVAPGVPARLNKSQCPRRHAARRGQLRPATIVVMPRHQSCIRSPVAVTISSSETSESVEGQQQLPAYGAITSTSNIVPTWPACHLVTRHDNTDTKIGDSGTDR